jgi:hypothetical protein
MKFQCICGKILSDNADEIPYKAHLIADEDWDRFIEEAAQKPRWWRLVTRIYQCPSCGCLRLEKPAGHVVFFKPENEDVSKSLLRSTEKS